MTICEKCWSDAYSRSYYSGKSVTEEYHKLLEERKLTPCAEPLSTDFMCRMPVDTEYLPSDPENHGVVK